MYKIDPLGIPFLQQALGGGQLTEQGLQQMLRAPGSPLSQGMNTGMSGLGSAAPAPIQMPQPVGSAVFGPSGRGPNQELMNALTGKPAEYNSTTGDWTPGPQGFPMPGGGGPGVATRLGGMFGK